MNARADRAVRILTGTAIVALLLVVASLVFIWWIGAWGIAFPSDHHDTRAPELPAAFGDGASLRVLVYSKTNAFRHKEGIPAAHALFDRLAAEHGWAVYHSENGALFDAEHLARFDVVVFANATGNTTSDAQDRAFETWIESGGGWVGLHAAGDGSHADWRWYQDAFIGGEFAQHILGPQFQEARVVVEDRAHPVTQGLPSEFRHVEEWYSWKTSARQHGFHVLLTVDESTYEPFIRFGGSETDIRMGDHPIAWSRCVGAGRAVYSAMGHRAEAYEDATIARLIANAVEWVGHPGENGCEAGATPERS
ncbi:MAG TPA: ThuA domain-containing protein [Myxococcota bacterium]|nr:ThuA domain-containing protein [Myxococcales bacterium]HPG24699.1 ThuA domain-containing protein [Myxococcota bacterium]